MATLYELWIYGKVNEKECGAGMIYESFNGNGGSTRDKGSSDNDMFN